MTGVTYTNVLNGEEFEQPAGLVVLCAYAINNVHLMLLSGIGKPYDPVAQTGVIGKNYCYQTGAAATLFFEGKYFNPFMGTGGLTSRTDDFHSNWAFDRSKYGYVGGCYARRRHDQRPADRVPPGARRHAALGQGVEGRDRQVVQQRDDRSA